MVVRLYSSVLRRFLQVDRIPGGSASASDYANTDPINRFDLGGHWPWSHHSDASVRNYFYAHMCGWSLCGTGIRTSGLGMAMADAVLRPRTVGNLAARARRRRCKGECPLQSEVPPLGVMEDYSPYVLVRQHLHGQSLGRGGHAKRRLTVISAFDWELSPHMFKIGSGSIYNESGAPHSDRRTRNVFSADWALSVRCHKQWIEEAVERVVR